LVFREAAQLRRLVPRLLHLGVVSFSSPDVLRFLGKKATRQSNAAGGLKLPLSSDLKIHGNGARGKHRLGPNSIKLYDQAYDEPGAVLRTEITISRPQYFRVYRRTDDPDSALGGRPLRQSTADMYHRAQVSGAALNRYCCALATADDTSTLEELTAPIERRRRWKGQSVRAAQDQDGAAPARRCDQPQASPAPRSWPHPQAPQIPPLRRHPQRMVHLERHSVGPPHRRPADHRNRSMSLKTS
jgi:hypothetical protein